MPSPDVIPEKTDDQKARELALEDLANIAMLRVYQPFQRYFMREPATRIPELTAQLRKRGLSDSDRQYILGQLDVLERWARKLEEDDEGCRLIAEEP